jgi:hypothetical protein
VNCSPSEDPHFEEDSLSLDICESRADLGQGVASITDHYRFVQRRWQIVVTDLGSLETCVTDLLGLVQPCALTGFPQK